MHGRDACPDGHGNPAELLADPLALLRPLSALWDALGWPPGCAATEKGLYVDYALSRIRLGMPAGDWLKAQGAAPAAFGHLGTRRCNHEIMTRGTFANVRIRNLMAPGTEGGVTVLQPGGEKLAIFDAATRYRAQGVPLFVFAGEDYGMGSSRDWAAKGPHLLVVKAVIARSFERIHRSNLVGMGVVPCQFRGNDSVQSLGMDGTETYDLTSLENGVKPRQDVTLTIRRRDGSTRKATLTLRVDIAMEVDYLNHGGILPCVLRQLLEDSAGTFPTESLTKTFHRPTPFRGDSRGKHNGP